MDSIVIAFIIGLRATFPMAELQDVYKSCYQDHFGAEHLMTDSASVARYIDYELASMDTTLIPDYEPCGYLHRHERVSLQLVRRGELGRDELLADFLGASVPHTKADSIEWIRVWSKVERVAVDLFPEWRDSTTIARLRHCAEHAYPVHHSDVYRRNYKPHYRIIQKK